jgi:hypothetical protein
MFAHYYGGLVLSLGEEAEWECGRGTVLAWPGRFLRTTRSDGDEDA